MSSEYEEPRDALELTVDELVERVRAFEAACEYVAANAESARRIAEDSPGESGPFNGFWLNTGRGPMLADGSKTMSAILDLYGRGRAAREFDERVRRHAEIMQAQEDRKQALTSGAKLQ
jgi:hypothetical protein